MEKDLLIVALRQGAVSISNPIFVDQPFSPRGIALVTELESVGYQADTPLLAALTALDDENLQKILDTVNEVMGVGLNWAPLVKGWLTPTGEGEADHILTLLSNAYNEVWKMEGKRLPCGHLIPDGTFPLERYNGCPFCGQPFVLSQVVYKGQGSELKPLRLWTDADLDAHLAHLLQSPVPLDATQADSLKRLLRHRPLPAAITIKMKETLVLVIDALLDVGNELQAEGLMKHPSDILRYLWYKHTGQLQMVEPRTLVKRADENCRHVWASEDTSVEAAEAMKKKLKLKYDRKTCRRVARWLNYLPLSATDACVAMHPKREIWVRMIRALRLAEYARRPSFERLAQLLDCFYKQDYTVWQGQLDRCHRERNTAGAMALLKQRPGTFARQLFSSLLWYGIEETLLAFNEVLPQLPPRLLFSLGNHAENYFNPEAQRVTYPLGGFPKLIPVNKLVRLHTSQQLEALIKTIFFLVIDRMGRQYATDLHPGRKVFIAHELMHIPLAVGDRSKTIQDTSCALQGTRFKLHGDKVRLFLQWGKGLKAQHLDMDISCFVAYDDHTDECAYFQLTVPGAKHSGDIRHIPNLVGTAEYIELDLDELRRNGARYVTFTCNAYSCGKLDPGLVVGWMDSKYPMEVSDDTGVAYDPSCVQHQVRISESNLAKGLVFGVLLVDTGEIVWLEIPFSGQNITSLDYATVNAYLKRLMSKATIGGLLKIKANAQKMIVVDDPADADEVYDYQWALDAARVSEVLLGG